MLHTQIQDDDVIERYVRRRLSPEEQQSFEEHFFACDECFQKVQTMEAFVAGVRDAAEDGRLDGELPQPVRSAERGWLRWGFALSLCCSAVLGILVSWLTLARIPKLQSALDAMSTQVQGQQQFVASVREQSAPAETPEANVPLVVLQSSRGDESPIAVLPKGAKRLVVWIEVGPTRYQSYRMTLLSVSNKAVLTVDGLTRGPYGALAASFPGDKLQAGNFRIRLEGQNSHSASLVGDYPIQIRRP